ncbi:MAG: transglycosylase domain-containing protein [Solirubrobacterales bacterium]|nr:transglycosylase domain-containing protein [Solirubrobacterales bacterium]
MSRLQRKQRRTRGRSNRIIMVGLLSVALCGLAGLGWVLATAASAPGIDQLRPSEPGATSSVFAADGSRLGFISTVILRSPLAEAEMPKEMGQATVAIEDRRFYQHSGVDYEGIVRAAVRNVTSGKTLQGGSTLTMQLARNLYIPGERSKKTIDRKIREAKWALQLEGEHSKSWILNSYMDDVAYGTVGGQTAVGVQAAARMFFDKPAKDLTLAECALLAGLPQAPSQYNAFSNPVGATRRRAEVLNAMAKSGDITQEQADAAKKEPLGTKKNNYFSRRREGFFFDYVTEELYRRYGVAAVRQGGLRINTTIEPKLQQAGRDAIAGRLGQPDDPASALVSMDPKTGAIRAMVSSADYGQTKFNYAAQGHRQPGSTFKVMVLVAALRKGIDPLSTTYESKELTPGWLDGYPSYSVATYGHNYSGSMNLLQATLQSDNTVYAQLDADVGPEEVRQTAYDMGIKTKLDAYPAEGLGGLTIGVSPLEMANAYSTLSDGGVRVEPVAITKVTFPDGHSDDLGKVKETKVFSDGIAAQATSILEQNVQGGTGTAAGYGCPAAGKTGTTSDYKDAWFVGFTPNLSTAVWVGYPNPPTSMTSVHGITVAGGTFPAEIWHDFMSVAHGDKCDSFPQPKEPFVGQAFFGGNTSSGSPTTTDSTTTSTQKKKAATKSPYEHPPTKPGGGGTGGGGTGGGTGGGGTGGGGADPGGGGVSPG